jgi:hypothetical protein
MTDAILHQALAFARGGWRVFPCLPGQKIPATPHGYRDATTDQQQIKGWFGRGRDWNLAVATGAPGPDVLDVDEHGEAGNGYAAFRQLREAGLLDGAAAYVRTPSGGLHAYFAGSAQHNGHLPAHHLDFRSAGGYILTPPSRIDGRPYQLVRALRGRGALDWDAVVRHLNPCSRPFKMSMKVTFRVAMCRHGEPRRAGCRAGFRWPGCRGGGQSVAVSSAMAVRAEDSSAMVLPAV